MLERAKIISGSELTLYVLRSNGRCDAEDEVLRIRSGPRQGTGEGGPSPRGKAAGRMADRVWRWPSFPRLTGLGTEGRCFEWCTRRLTWGWLASG